MNAIDLDEWDAWQDSLEESNELSTPKRERKLKPYKEFDEKEKPQRKNARGRAWEIIGDQ